MQKPENKIPKGDYCYNVSIVCPFWRKNKSKPEQESGYCSYLKCGDWETGGLLWDMVKECGINTEE